MFIRLLVILLALVGSARTVVGGQATGTSIYAEDRLVNIEITLDAEDWKTLRVEHRKSGEGYEFSDKPYRYAKADVVIDGVTFRNVGVRKKGFFGSVTSLRPSLKIRFDKFEEDQFFGDLDQLTLNNNLQDASQLQQYLAYRVFREAGVPAPRCNFALVTVNGEYLGVYSNVESIRAPFLRRVFGSDEGRLYEGYAGDIDDVGTIENSIVSKRGKPDAGRKPLIRLRDLLAAETISLDEIREHIDVDSFILFWASEVLLGHWDSYSGNRNNYYLFRDDESKRLHFIPWGADSIGRDPGPFIRQEVPRSVKAVGVLCRRMWELPEVRDLYRQTLNHLLNTVWNETALLAESARISTMLESHVTVSTEWRQRTIEFVETFIRERRAQISAELEGDHPEWPTLGADRANTPRPPVSIRGTFSTRVLAEEPTGEEGVGAAHFAVTVAGTPVAEFGGMSSFALEERPRFIRPGYPQLTLTGRHPETDKTWSLLFYLDPIRVPDEMPSIPIDHFAAWAVLYEDDPQLPGTPRTIFGIRGGLVITRFGTELGDTIEGAFSLTTPGAVASAEDSTEE